MHFDAEKARKATNVILVKKEEEYRMEACKVAREKSQQFKAGEYDAFQRLGEIESLICLEVGKGRGYATYQHGPFEWSGPKLAYLEGLSSVILSELTSNGYQAVVNIIGTKISGTLMLDVGVGW